MTYLTINSRGGGGFLPSLYNLRKGVQDVVSCAHRRVVSAI